MKRTYTGIIIGLFAIAALEFGLLGADAAGLTGGGAHVPPVIERGVIDTPTATATATPFLTPFPLTPISPPQVDITGAFLQADPLTIRCDGSQNSLVTVRLIQSNGDPAPDGTPVYFLAYNGGVKPPYGNTTTDGYVTVSVWFYSDIFPQGPNLIVRSGLFEAGIRIRCLPVSDGGCALSPPISPPCAPTSTPTPTPAIPPTCNPSPGSGPMSPPCPTEPPCSISPPSVSPPCATPAPECPVSPPSASPPCATPPVVSDLVMAIDCDTGVAGIQDSCTISNAAAEYDVDVYLTNNGGETAGIEAFDVNVDDGDRARLRPIQGAFSGLNENPDFQAVQEPTGWQCLPTIGDVGWGEVGHAVSIISCVDFELNAPITIPPGLRAKLFTVHYEIPLETQPGDVSLSFLSGNFFNIEVTQLGSCTTESQPLMECLGATVEVVDRTPPKTPAPTATAPVRTATAPARTATAPARTATAPARTATAPARTATAAPEPTKKPRRRCADVNSDGRVSFRDIRLISEQIARGVYDEQ